MNMTSSLNSTFVKMEEAMDSFSLIDMAEGKEVVSITKEVVIDDETQIRLDVDALRSVLVQDDIADLPVAIYSVAGPSRTGKSFLLNLMMRHIHLLQTTDGNGADTTSEVLKDVFSWRGGVDAHTRGIEILKKPFLLKTSNGRQIALFLMDTQGIFDMETAEQEHNLMGALSFLMSSKQVFNLKGTIDSRHIDHIIKFAKLAEEIRRKNKHCTPFQQQSLMFTIRDWEMEDYTIGFKGGENYFEKRIKGSKARALEHNLKKECLNKTFGEIPCYLLPPPANSVKKMGEKDRTCRIRDIGDPFLASLRDLFKNLLSAEGITLKKINGTTVSCRQLYDYLDAYASIVNSKEGLERNTQHFLEVDAITAMNHIIQEYCKNFMQNLWNQLSTERTNKPKHQAISDDMRMEMMKIFDSSPKPDVPQFIKKYRNVLDRLLESIFEAYQNGFKAEDLYEDAMINFQESLSNITPQHTLMYKKYIEEATEKLKSIATDLKKKIHKSISDQCCKYFWRKEKS